jgi:hypothetical protein
VGRWKRLFVAVPDKPTPSTSVPAATRLAAVKAEAAQRLNRDNIEIGLGFRIRSFQAANAAKRTSATGCSDSAPTMTLLAGTRKD